MTCIIKFEQNVRLEVKNMQYLLIEILTADYTTRFLCQKYSRKPINSKLPQVGKIIHFAKYLDSAAYKTEGTQFLWN